MLKKFEITLFVLVVRVQFYPFCLLFGASEHWLYPKMCSALKQQYLLYRSNISISVGLFEKNSHFSKMYLMLMSTQYVHDFRLESSCP